MNDQEDLPESNIDINDGFSGLTPDTVMAAVESLGLWSDGRQMALNSYENRVYQVGIDESEPVIVKFYRPNRWTDEAILEEQAFCFELAEQELPVVLPEVIGGKTLHHFNGLRFSLFKRRGGRAPEFDNLDNLFILGQTLGQMHTVGAAQSFRHRPALNIETFGRKSVETVAATLLPDGMRDNYLAVCHQLLDLIEQQTSKAGEINWIRCHGDCHVGNILWRDDMPNFVDFDDARTAPAVQDLWMMLSGERHHQQVQMLEILEGYEMFSTFDRRQLHWIEPLRTLRMMHYSAWLAKRWGDPAFPMHFPWFNTERYWGEHLIELREQQFALQEPMYGDDFLKLY